MLQLFLYQLITSSRIDPSKYKYMVNGKPMNSLTLILSVLVRLAHLSSSYGYSQNLYQGSNGVSGNGAYQAPWYTVSSRPFIYVLFHLSRLLSSLVRYRM